MAILLVAMREAVWFGCFLTMLAVLCSMEAKREKMGKVRESSFSTFVF
jgi:hypothetical protein